MSIRSVHRLVACVACLMLLAKASAFKLGFNFNQWSSEMLTRKSEWAPALAKASGVMGIGALNPTMPLSRSQVGQVVNLFAPATAPRFKIHINTWSQVAPYVAQGTTGKAAFNAAVARQWPDLATPETLRFVYDGATVLGTLTVAQLDQMRAAKFHKVLIIFRKWDNAEQEAAIKAAIKHPWCLGIIVEAFPLTISILPSVTKNPKIAVTQWTLTKTNKPVYILSPPGPATAAHKAPTQVGRYQIMLNDLLNTIGQPLLCSDRLTMILAAYNVKDSGVPFFPALTNPADPLSFGDSTTGAMLYMAKAMDDYCPPPPAP